jgi:hypothetical protein
MITFIKIAYRVTWVGLLLLLGLVVNSCRKADEDVTPVKQLTWFDYFGKALDDSLKAKKVGYGFVILEKGEVRASGSGKSVYAGY